MKSDYREHEVNRIIRAGEFGARRCFSILAVCLTLLVCMVSPDSFGSTSEPDEQKPSLEATLSFDSVRLTIAFDEQLFDSAGESTQSEQLATACRVWREAFALEQGPWGFGIAADVSCIIRDSLEVKNLSRLKSFDHWLLSVQKVKFEEKDAISSTLCRVRAKPNDSDSNQDVVNKDSGQFEEKCEAQRIIPWTSFRVRLLRHRAFVRLLAASLLDQLPFISAVTRKIVHFDRLGIRGLREVDTDEVSFPPPPSQLLFAEVRYNPYSNRFRLKEVPLREAIYRTMNRTGVVWVINKNGRGSLNDEFTRRLKDAFLSLTTQFQLDVLRFERERIRADAEKYKEKSALNFIFRGDYLIGVPLFSMNSARGATALLGLEAGVGFGGLLGASYLDSRYSLETQLQEKDNTNQASNSIVALREFGFWLQPQVGRRFSDSLLPASYQLGARFGFFSSGGQLVGVENLPQQQLSLSTKEFALGLGLGVDIPLSSQFLVSSEGQFDFGLTAQSTTLRASVETAWVAVGSLAQNVKSTSPLKLGLGGQFSSLGRRFATSGSSAKIETLVTLNGLLGFVFVEKIF